MSETVYIIAGGVALLLIGLGLGFWAAQLRNGKQVAKAADVQKQFDDYRQNVTEHFGRTAEHFQSIGEQYRELYEHMASGATTLLDPQALDDKLSFMQPEKIEPPADFARDEAEAPIEEQAAVTDDQEAEPATQADSDADADDSQRTYH